MGEISGLASSDARDKLEKIRGYIEAGRVGSFNDLKRWIYENMPNMEFSVWSELRTLLKQTYTLTDAELATAFASVRNAETPDDFTPLVESLGIEGFLKDGMEHTSNMEAPNAFGFWSFLTILAASLRRQCYIDMGYYKIWPTTQCILVGPSQKVRKSTIGSYIVELGEVANRFNRLMEEGSAEALKGELTDLTTSEGESTGLLFVSEMSVLLGEKDYNKDLIKNLTDLFDSKNYMKRKTYAHGVQEMRNMAISSIMCSNEAWLREGLPRSAFDGGFVARCLIIHQAGTEKIVPIPTLADPTARDKLIEQLRRTAFVEGPAVLSGGARDYYVERYHQLKESWPEDERLHPFWNKYPVHLLRTAMLLSVSEDMEQRGGVTMEQRHVEQADALMRWIYDKMPGLYRQLGTTEHGDQAIDVLNYIRNQGGKVDEKALGRAMVRKMPKYKLTEIINNFKELGLITKRTGRQMGSPVEIILIDQEGV